MAELAASWWAWLAPATLQATLLLAAAWIVDRALGRRVWPQLLTTLWLVALARLLLPPTLESPWSVTTAVGAPTLEAAAGTGRDPRLAWLALAWSAGALACLAARARRRRALGLRIVELDLGGRADWRAALEAAASSMQLARLPRLGTLEGLTTPAVSGLLRPILLLPRAALERSPTRHDHGALLHELAHIRRCDLWLDEACELLRAFFWFHPLVWLAVARIRALGEVACDATVARVLGGGAPDYRDTLVLAARDAFLLGEPAGVRAFVGRPSALLARLEHLERLPRAPLAAVRAASTALALALFACVLPMAPASAALRASAQRVLEAQMRGERQSCFTLHAAALVLAADAPATSSPSRD
jgi:beta-lactamase regulating signal transducer with metallopeptidase domain